MVWVCIKKNGEWSKSVVHGGEAHAQVGVGVGAGAGVEVHAGEDCGQVRDKKGNATCAGGRVWEPMFRCMCVGVRGLVKGNPGLSS